MDLYNPAELLGVVDTIIPEQSFWLPNYFGEVVTFDTEEIMFDRIAHQRTLAPFVAPNNQGRPLKNRGYNTRAFKPAYIKPKDALTPNQTFIRQAGERINGSLSPQQRWDANVTWTLSNQVRAIRRRLEWMACQAALYATLTIVAEDYPSTTVDFLRDAGNRIVLTGTARWGQSAADVIGNLESWAQIIFTKTGYYQTDYLLSPDVWAVMRKDPGVLALLETRRGSASNAEIGPVAKQQYKKVAELGEFSIWIYSDTYVDENGTAQNFMPAGSVFLGSAEGMKGIQAFGAILDQDANLQPQEIFSNMWKENDPPRTFIMSQSAPLMVPREPNATVFATVL